MSAARLLAAAALLIVPACRADEQSMPTAITEERALTVDRGSEFTITLQTVGPGEYVSPPAVSSAVVQFLDVRQAAVSVPAGPTQQFRFRADQTGTATVEFRHTESAPAVTATVVVRWPLTEVGRAGGPRRRGLPVACAVIPRERSERRI